MPDQRSSLSHAGPVDAAAEGSPAGGALSPTALVTPCTVFLVEDDDAVRRSLGRLLRALGVPFESYASAAELLSSPPRGRPGCVLVDLRLPGIHGLDIERELRALGCVLPLVYMTGFNREAERAAGAGATGILRKPFSGDALLEAIERALGQPLFPPAEST